MCERTKNSLCLVTLLVILKKGLLYVNAFFWGVKRKRKRTKHRDDCFFKKMKKTRRRERVGAELRWEHIKLGAQLLNFQIHYSMCDLHVF